MTTTCKAKPFSLGEVVATRGAIAAMEAAGDNPILFLLRHLSGDWGEMCDDDWALNDESLKSGGRLHSAYDTSKGERIWVITEWDFSVTTLLLPDEY